MFTTAYTTKTDKLNISNTGSAINSLKTILYSDSNHPQKGHANDKMMKAAFTVYSNAMKHRHDRINESGSDLIHLMIKICLKSHHPEKVFFIWDHIIDMHKISSNLDIISYILLIKCLLKMKMKHGTIMEHCITILQWMQSYHSNVAHHLKEYSIHISKLISISKDLNTLKHIDSLLIIHDDVFITTAFIKKYGDLQDIDTALHIFHSMHNKDPVMIAVMMKQLLNNKCYHRCLSLYINDEYQTLNNDILHVLALKACVNSNNLEKGKEIHAYVVKNGTNNAISAELNTCLFGFYGDFGDIETAKQLFKSRKLKTDIIAMNCMMTVLINNEYYDDALSFYDTIDITQKNVVTFLLGLKACTHNNSIEGGIAIHNEIKQKHGVFRDAYYKEKNNYNHLLNVLMHFYATFDMPSAVRIYNEMKDDKLNDIFSVLSVMKGYINNGLMDDALAFYDQEYDEMAIQSNSNTFVLKTLFRGFLDIGQTRNAENVWNNINGKYMKSLFDTQTLQLLILCIHRTQKYYQYHDDTGFLCNVWNLIVHQLGVKPDLNCYSIAILAFSKYNHKSFNSFFDKVFDAFKRDLSGNTEMMEQLRLKPVEFHQILSGLGHANKWNEMWFIYNIIIKEGNAHDMVALNILLQFENRKERRQYILNIIKSNAYLRECCLCTSYIKHECTMKSMKNARNCIMYNNDMYKASQLNHVQFDIYKLRLYEMITLYLHCDDDELQSNIWRLLNEPNINESKLENNIVALFKDKNEEMWIVQNGMNHERDMFNSIHLLNELMKKTQYKIDTSVCVGSLTNNKTRELHLKYHAEKKALAILLYEMEINNKSQDLCVAISLKMCRDCHAFFAAMSRYYNTTITCYDTNGAHIFSDGICNVCSN